MKPPRLRFPAVVFLLLWPWLATASSPFWNWRNPQPRGTDITGATYGGGLFVTVGSAGSINTSTDGQSWSAPLSGVGGELASVAYGNGRFVVVGSGAGGVLTSTDGRLWLHPLVQVPADWQKATRIAFGGGRFVAVGSVGFIAYSTDGTAWTSVVSGTDRQFAAVAYGGGGFVAVAEGGDTFFSTDGIQWSKGGNLGAGTFNGRLAYGGGHWLALNARYQAGTVGVIEATSVATSVDGVAWAAATDLAYPSATFDALAFFHGRFYAWGTALPLVSSADGGAWRSELPAASNPAAFQPHALAASADRLVMAGRFGVLEWSADGATWTTYGSSTVTGDLRAAAYGNGRWIVAGTQGLARSDDAVKWSMIPAASAYNSGAVAYGNGLFVATTTAGGVGVSSDNGETWTGAAPFSTPMRRLVFGHGRFVGFTDSSVTAAGTVYSELVSSTDGVNWSPGYRVPEAGSGWRDLAWADGVFIAIGGRDPEGPTLCATSADGVSWTQVASFNQVANAVAGRAGLYVVAGYYGDIWTSTDTQNWTYQGKPLQAAGPISSMTVVNGQFVGCTFFGRIVTSDNGADWQIDDFSGSGMMWAIAAGGDQVIAVGNGGAIWEAGQSRFVNNAARARVSSGSGALIMGFVITGSAPKTMLIRGVGPALADYQVPDALSAPTLTVYDTIATKALATNTGWRTASDPAALAAAAQQVGAFALKDANADSAVLVTLPPGIYSASVTGGKAGGIALVEAYEVGPNPSRIVNMSTRANVGTGDDVLIPGLVIVGDAPRTVLIRAVGPTLANFGVDHVLEQPVLTLMNGTVALAANQGWGTNANAADLAKAAQRVGAFSLPSGSADSALLVTVNPGVYSLKVSGAGDTSGVALVEVYEVP